MGFLEQNTLAEDAGFLRKVEHAMLKSAVAVVAESVGTTNHASRTAWATQVLRTPEQKVRAVAKAVVTNASITIASADADIEFTINSQWDAFAGAP